MDVVQLKINYLKLFIKIRYDAGLTPAASTNRFYYKMNYIKQLNGLILAIVAIIGHNCDAFSSAFSTNLGIQNTMKIGLDMMDFHDILEP